MTDSLAVRVRRIAAHPTDGTFGVIIIAGIPISATLELPWRDNQHGISCIPAGAYVCKRVNSPKFGSTFEICQVPNRTEILLHGANTVDDLRGCVGLAEFFTRINGKLGIANPVKGMAFTEFKEQTAHVDIFNLIISEHFG